LKPSFYRKPSFLVSGVDTQKEPLTCHEGTGDERRYGSAHSSNRCWMRMGL